MKIAEVLQSLTILSGLVTAAVGAIIWRMRLTNSQALKRIDVSAEWQNQMLLRISTVEAELQRERVRNDELEREAFQWRSTAAELEWELNRTRAERHRMTEQLDDLETDNKLLREQNVALAKELREMHKQIRSGFQGLSVPPPPPPTPKPTKK